MSAGVSTWRHPGSLALGVAIALASATQLRAPGLPIGLGEGLLAAWVVAATLVILGRRHVVASHTSMLMSGFWILTMAVLLSGWIMGLMLDVWEPAGTHDALSLAFSAAVVVALVLQPDLPQRSVVVSRGLMAASTIPLTLLLLAAATGRLAVGPAQVLLGTRFRGWAENPNQISLLVLPMPALAWMQLRQARSRAGRLWSGGVLLAAVGIGITSQSDALFLAWSSGAAVVAARWWLRGIMAPRQSLLGRSVALFVLPAVVAGGLVTMAPRIWSASERAAATEYDEGGQGLDRFDRWRHGLEAGARSPVVGLGPGSFSGPYGPFQGEEAHNTFIDWFASTGAIGVALLVSMLSAIGFRVFTGGSLPLLFAFVALLVFMMFHFVLRQPVVWFYFVALMAQSGTDADRERR